MNMISDLTARDFGGYHAVLAVHAEGSIEAEKMQIYRAYEPGRALAYATPRRHRLTSARELEIDESERMRARRRVGSGDAGRAGLRRGCRCPWGSGRRGRRACRRGSPAAARSSSDSPPQKPYSRCSRAHWRHGVSTSQSLQTARALASRTVRVSGRSPAGAKKRSFCPGRRPSPSR